ncbi:copine-8-like isoform X2 [Ruditapes philippinarum]|uniref:copine-8-like isoform X2 n=1 Tax=Ruditapes philippinarum TaxID=129788 RepID=UPI00295C0FA0|nr:copine-8-like isoform X2 [Ruditapes philippinarum]
MAGIPGQGFQAGSAAAPSSQVEISVSCRNLRDKDAFSKSDPMCVLYCWDIKANSFHEFGRTEMIKDTLNPDFVKKFTMSYFFEESQKLKFEIYDVDSPSGRLSSHDFLGRMECTLGEIVGCGSGQIEKKLLGIQGTAKIFVRTEELSSSKETVYMQLRASGLDKKDFLGKSDPFLIFYRANGDGIYTVVHKTEVIKNTLNPTWKPFSVTARTLCNGDHDRTIKVECYDWDSDGSHDLIGEFTTNLKELVKAPTSNTMFQVINPKKKAKKRNYKNSGELMVMNCKTEIVPSFLDYLQGGVEMNFTVAIDFTASNGNPSQPNSLHYYDPYKQNQYALAIQAVGEIIQDYDSDKLFPVLGFGARLPDGSVSFEFPCNFNPNNPYCAGIPGVLQAYYTSLKQVQLYGPTNFSPVINHVMRFASAKQDGSSYFVLLIITDGVISDMNHTISSIINASSLPMSIIIVGVGNAEFDAMDVLDADGRRLGIEGRYAERDIVQFVPFRDFMKGAYGNNQNLLQAALAKSVLAEIPDQVVNYMKKKGIKPKPQRPARPMAPSTGGAQPGQQGQGPYPGAQPGGQPQQQGQGPYPGAQPGYPQGGKGNVHDPQGAGQTPYPQGGAGQTPYPQGSGGGGNAPPYPQGAGGQAPYPQGGAGAPPYPQGAGGQAPYPQGGVGAPPYPQGAGQAPYPQGSAGAPPYPQGGGGQAPYPQGGAGAPPYPQGAGGQAPYPQGGAGGAPPYPQGGAGGASPYPQGGSLGHQASAPYSSAPGGPPKRPPPTYQNANKQ